MEVTYPDGRTEILCMGNSFGVSPTMEKEYMKGVMRTKVDDCQVQCLWYIQIHSHTGVEELSEETPFYFKLNICQISSG